MKARETTQNPVRIQITPTGGTGITGTVGGVSGAALEATPEGEE